MTTEKTETKTPDLKAIFEGIKDLQIKGDLNYRTLFELLFDNNYFLGMDYQDALEIHQKTVKDLVNETDSNIEG